MIIMNNYDLHASIANNGDIEETIKILGGSDRFVAEDAIAKLVKIGNDAVPALIKALDNENRDIRAGAAEALGLIGNKSALDPLLQHLESLSAPEGVYSFSQRYFRSMLIQALGKLKDPKAVKVLKPLLTFPDVYDQTHAIVALEKIGDPQAFDLLVARLKHSDRCIRNIAAQALGQTAKQEAIKPLIETLSDSSWVVRDTAVAALGELGFKEAIGEVEKMLTDPSYYVQETAKEALKKLKG